MPDLARFENVTVLRETEKAILCEIDGKQVWLPKSQIHDDSEVYKMGTEGELVISQWLAEEKDLV
jgi:hypothetical protein